MTPDEARFEQWIEELYDEHAEIAVEEFASERLSSYYLRFPQIFHAPRQALVEGSSLIPNHPRAGFILASIAVEVSLKELILRPIVHGLVVSESTASIVTDLVMSYRPMVRFKKLLIQIGNEVISEDFDELTRDGKTATLWKEVERIRCKRNAVVHSACSVNIDEAMECLEIARYILESLFPRFLAELGLAIDRNHDIKVKHRVEYEEFVNSRDLHQNRS